MSIRAKLVSLIFIVLGMLALAAYSYFPRRMEQQITEAFASDARSISRLTAFSVAPALFFDDRLAAADALRGAREAARVAYIVVEDAQGRLFAELGLEDDTRAAYRLPFSFELGSGEPLFRASEPVAYRGERMGRIYIGMSLEQLQGQISAMRQTIAWATAFVFSLVVGATVVIGNVITRPLRQMVEASQEITRGRWEARAPVRSRDEAGELATSFNLMLDHLAEARRELERLNRDLEGRVEQRTAALTAANDRFALAAAAVEGAIYDRDLSAHSGVVWSDGLARVFGYPPAEVRPDFEWWAERIHPDDHQRVIDLATLSVRDGLEFTADYRFRHRDGRFLYVLDRGRVLRRDDGTPTRMVGIMEDVSDLKRLEQQFQQAQKMEAVGRLAGGVAHDFNNLLTAILGYSDLLRATLPAGDPSREPIEEIFKAGRRAADLTQQLLAFSRKQVIEPQPIEVNAIVTHLEKMLGRLIGEDIVLETRLDPAAGTVNVDPSQFEQTILNLAVNSRDAMPHGGRLVISTRAQVLDETFCAAHEGSRPGHYAVLTLSDTGTGMDTATLAHAFEPFFTTKGVGKGTGLGLSTVYGFIKQSDGYVEMASQPGGGTTVTIYLPSLRLPAAAKPPAHPPAEPYAGKPVAPGHETILLLEDEKALRGLVEGVLRSHGHTVLGAGSADEGLRLSAEHHGPIHLVLTDVVMPGMSGREFVTQIRRERPQARILYVSGYTDDAILRQGIKTSEAAFLGKPFTPSALMKKVREVLDA